VLAYIHHIRDLSDWFLYLNDDMMLWENFKVDTLFKRGLPIQHLGGGSVSSPSQKAGLDVLKSDFGARARTLDTHVPLIAKKCLMQEIEVTYADRLYKCNSELPAPLCDFKQFHFNSFYQNYAIDRKAALEETWRGFGTEVHINHNHTPDRIKQRLDLLNNVQWVNLQGVGASEEYKINNPMRVMVDEFYFRKFPTKAPWETEWEDM